MNLTARLNIIVTKNATYDILSDWQSRFVDSILSQLEKGRKLSVRQNDIVQKIEAKFSQASMEEMADWQNNWDQDKTAIARMCAKYYLQGGIYFRDIAKRVLEDPEWVMPQVQYEKMCLSLIHI